MAVRIRKAWAVAALMVALTALLGWAWWQGGAEVQRELSAPTNLPRVVQ